MYLGYMKKGLQYMLMFAASIYIAYLTEGLYFEWVCYFFVMLLPVIWFYQMFDAMHSVARMKRQEIEFPSDDGFFLPERTSEFSPLKNRTVTKGIAIALILIGVVGIVFGALDNLHYFFDWERVNWIVSVIRRNLMPAVVSIVLIIVGCRLLAGGKGRAHTDKERD
jgi:hypothetical protein